MEMEIRRNGSLVVFGILMIVAVLVAFIIGFGSVNIAHAEEIKVASPAVGASPAANPAPEAPPSVPQIGDTP